MKLIKLIRAVGFLNILLLVSLHVKGKRISRREARMQKKLQKPQILVHMNEDSAVEAYYA